MLRIGLSPNLVALQIQVSVKIAFKVLFDDPFQVLDIARPAHESVLSRHDVVPQRPNLSRDHRKSETEGQKQHSALKDHGVGQHGNVSGFEVQLRVAVRNEFEVLNHAVWSWATRNRFLNRCHLLHGVLFRFSGNDQTVVLVFRNQAMESLHQIFQALVGTHAAEKKYGLVALPDAQALSRLGWGEVGIGHGIVNAERNNGHRLVRNSEFFQQFGFHFRGMDEDVVHQPVLDLQRNAVQPGVVPVALGGVHIVRRKYDPLSADFVPECKQGAIERGELIVPKHVKDLWLGSRGVDHQPQIRPQYLVNPGKTAAVPAAAVQVDKPEAHRGMHFWTIQRIAAHNLKRNLLRHNLHRQAIDIRRIDAAGQQGYPVTQRWLSHPWFSRGIRADMRQGWLGNSSHG